MKLKKGVIIICLLICLFSIASVSASDVNDTLVSSDEQNDDLIEIENQDNVGATEEDNLTASVGTFANLANEIANANGELNLTRNYSFSNYESYKQGIEINKKITINGNGFTIDGGNQARVFKVSNGNVQLENIKFINSYYETGGAVYWAGSYGILSNCSFVNCSAPYGSSDGGAVYWAGSYGILSNCSFVNCSASSSSSSSSRYGGAVYWSGLNGVLNNSIFVDCSANSNGGAVYWYSSNGVLSYCNFVNCSTVYNGAAIFHCNAYNCSFINCFARDGGAVYNCNAYNCSFLNCSVSRDGCAVYNGNAYNCSFIGLKNPIYKGNAYNCSFMDCFDEINGYGAIFLGNAFNCSFVNCTSEFDGGVICNGNAFNCSFRGCSAGSDGGVIYDGNAFNCSFVGCSSQLGGAIAVGNATNCSFVDCFAEHSGGAIYNGNAFNCSFVGCSANFGGAISYGNATNCTFTKCSAKYDGGAIYRGNAYNSSFEDCSDNNGNVIYQGTMVNCTILQRPFISASPVTVNYGEDAVININLKDDVPGNVRFTVNGVTKRVKIINGIATCTISDLNPGTYDVNVYYAGNYKYAADSIITTLKVLKLSPIISVSVNDCIYGEDAQITVFLANDVPGNVRFTVNGVTEKAKITNGKAIYGVSGLIPNVYEVTVYYAGNYKYKAETIITSFNVEKLNPFISVSPVTVNYGQNAKFTVNLFSDVPGNVKFIVNGASEKVKISNGKATFIVSGLNYGLYDVEVYYAGNYKYAAGSISSTLKVNKNPAPIVSVDTKNITYGEEEIITVNLAQNVPGNVHVTVNNVTKKAKINNNVATATFTRLNKGTYDVKVNYNGNANYNAQTKTTSFNVAKANPIIKVYPPSDIFYGEDQNIDVDLANYVTGNLNFNVNGVNYKVKVNGNRVSLNLPYLNSKYYNVKVYYSGSANFNAQSLNVTFNVAKANPIKSVTVDDIVYGSSEIVTVKLAKNVNGNVRIIINDVTHTVKINNGVASLSITDLNAGFYNVKVTYAGSANFNSQTRTTSFNVGKADPIISLTAYDIFTDENTEIIVKLHNKATGSVKIILNENEYNVPISSHEAVLNVGGLKNGIYSVNALYESTSNFYSQIELTSFRVLKIYPGIDILVNLKGSDVAITGILPSDATGNAIISINGHSYSCKIVSGIASTAISDLQSGTYDITIRYPGDEKYGDAIITRTFTFTTSQEIVYPPAPEQDTIITLIPEYDKYVSVRAGDYTISTMIWNATSINGAGIWVSANGQTVDKNMYSTRLHYYLDGEWKWSAWGQGNEGALYHKYALDKTAIVDTVQIKF